MARTVLGEEDRKAAGIGAVQPSAPAPAPPPPDTRSADRAERDATVAPVPATTPTSSATGPESSVAINRTSPWDAIAQALAHTSGVTGP